jgi:hypothetical protein
MRHAAILLSLAAGCFSPSFQSGHLRCEQGTTCPPGFYCASDATCWRNGETPHGGDGGATTMDMATTTAPLDMAGTPCGNAAGKCVFVTSRQYAGNLGGLAGADQTCQSLASAAHLGGTFKAWLSDGTNSPSTRFTKATVPYRLIDGEVVAANWTALLGATTTTPLMHTISLTETGVQPPTGTNACGKTTVVWSNSDRNGASLSASCSSWTSSASTASGGQGAWDQVAGGWTDSCSSTPCDGLAALFCFEQ